jgi:hypothetical protein
VLLVAHSSTKPPTTHSTPLPNNQQHNPLLYQTINNTIHSSTKQPTTQSTLISNHQQHNPLLYQTTNNTIHSSIKPPTTQSTPLSKRWCFDREVDCVVGDLIEEWIVLLVV